MIKLKVIANIFEEDGRFEHKVKFREGMSLADAMAELPGKVSEIPSLTVHLLGREIPRAEWPEHRPQDGSEYTVICHVEAVAIVALIYGVTTAVAATYTVAVAIVNIIISVVVSLVISLIASLFAPHPQKQGGGGMRSSPTFGWDGIQTTYKNGVPVALPYGDHEQGGNCIGRYIESDGDKQYLHVLLSLGVGPVEDITDIRINDNPIANFKGATYETRLGTDDQLPINGFQTVIIENPLSVKLLQNAPYTYQTAGDSVDAFAVNIVYPAGLYRLNESGNMAGYSVTYQIEWRVLGTTPWSSSGPITLTSGTRSLLRRTWRKDGLATGQYEIRVTRLTPDDPDDINYSSELDLAGVDEIEYEDLAYPRYVLLALRLLATDQLNGSMPNITCTVKGRKLKAWDGNAWQVPAFTKNTAWIAWDAMTADCGGGAYGITEANLDLDSFYAFAQYCDEQVPDGRGGMEARCETDIVLDGETGFWEVINQMLVGAQATLAMSGNKYKVLIDRAGTPVQLFNMGKIKQGTMSGFSTPLDNRYTAVRVEFMDPASDWQMVRLPIMPPGTAATEVKFRDVSLLGVTRLSQVMRVGTFMLNCVQFVRRTITFEAGIQGVAVQPGDLFYVSHDLPQWGWTGTVSRAAGVDDFEVYGSLSMDPGKTYHILIISSADDTIQEQEVSSVETTAEGCTRLRLAAPLSFTPAVGDNLAFGEINKVAKVFRCLDIARTNDLDVKITGIEYNDTVYNTDDVAAPTVNISALPDFGAAPGYVTDITLKSDIMRQGDGTIVAYIDACWVKPADPMFGVADVYLSTDGGTSWDRKGSTSDVWFRIAPVQDGSDVQVKVVSRNLRSGRVSDFSGSPSASLHVLGKLAPPPDVTGLSASSQGATVMLDWAPVKVPDLKGYEIREGIAWDTAAPVQVLYSGSHYEFETTVSGTHYYLMKAVDTSGNYSVNAVQATVDVTIDTEGVTIFTSDELTASGGTGSGVTQYPDAKEMDLDTVQKYDDGSTYDSGGTYDAPTGSSGTWTTSEKDIGGVFTVKTAVEVLKTANLNISFEICYKNAAGDSYGAWEALSSDTRTFRYFMLRATLTSSDTTQAAKATKFTVKVLAPTFTAFSDIGTVVAVGGTRIDYPQAFSQAPVLNVTAIGATGFRAANITAQDAAGFNVKVYDITGTDVGGTINWKAEGV